MTGTDVHQYPLVTIALPAYNAGKYLRSAVQSLINQSMPDYELLVFDDWGGDPAVEDIKSIIDPRIRIITDGKNLGLAARLNQAIGMARGRYFARMDHDDICHPERLTRQTEFLEAHPETDLLAAACVAIDEDDRLIGTLPLAVTHEEICQRPWQGFYMPHPTWMGRLDWFKAHLYSPAAPYFCEDQELLLRTHKVSHFQALPEHLLAYRTRSNPPFRRRVRTRYALAGVQMDYFFANGAPLKSALSLGVMAVRIGADLLGAADARLRGQHQTMPLGDLSPAIAAQWQEIIVGVEGKAGSQIE